MQSIGGGAAARMLACVHVNVQQATLGLVLASLLAACSTPPAPPAAEPPPAPLPVGGQVLGRSERFVLYQPVAGDTLKSIAARYLGSESRDWVIADFNDMAQAEPGRVLAVPLTAIDPIGVAADQYQTVPILCYHRFSGGNGVSNSKMVVTAGNFAAQLDWLSRNDYRVISLAQLTGFLEGHQALPKRSVVITIDDGYESVHRHALPVLRKYGFPATLFAYTDFIGAADALSWQQLQELAASGLVDVQAHSKSHRNLIERDAAETDAHYRQVLDAETRTPRDLLERKLGSSVRHFAYPYGDANQSVLDTLARQRFQLGVTVTPGGNGFFAQPLMLRRTMIYGDQDLAAFKAKLQIARSVGGP